MLLISKVVKRDLKIINSMILLRLSLNNMHLNVALEQISGTLKILKDISLDKALKIPIKNQNASF